MHLVGMCLMLGNLAHCWLCSLSVTRQLDDFIKIAKAGKLARFHKLVFWEKVCWWLLGIGEEKKKEKKHSQDHSTESRKGRS